jgi:hypothetical protein
LILITAAAECAAKLCYVSDHVPYEAAACMPDAILPFGFLRPDASWGWVNPNPQAQSR